MTIDDIYIIPSGSDAFSISDTKGNLYYKWGNYTLDKRHTKFYTTYQFHKNTWQGMKENHRKTYDAYTEWYRAHINNLDNLEYLKD